ncbi:hypothetical protein ACH4ZX_07765 [Streptomyces sp. NPDC020490]|uniref:hypothetical protein n=1 Tax=Streptomyces sp. NPDC020490 TaxID=3365078 RepID=UPI0037A62D16
MIISAVEAMVKGRLSRRPGEPETSRVEWSGVYTPAGVGDEEAVALFQGIRADGLDALLRTVTAA